MRTLALTGDVMLGRGVNEALKSMRPADPWGDVLPLLAQADLRIVNLECALTAHEQPWSRGWKMFNFRADPETVEVLKAARIDACSLANNHTLDFEEQGLLDTLQVLDAAGILHAGAGVNAQEAAQPALFETRESTPWRVAMLAFTDNEPGFAAQSDRPGTNFMEVATDDATLARIASGIAQAREQGADLVVFSNHWGANFIERPSPAFRNFARRVIELGADVYYGHSAHLCQGIELHQGKPILYDTGDFIDDYAVHPLMRNDRSCLFRLGFEERELRKIELFPVTLSVAQVALARGAELDDICQRMTALCRELSTPLVRQGDRLAWEKN
ncbi:capsule biosynthesis protein [Ferrigenium kumadai]|uniref:Capsule biosynthesis protein n=1 Tax=Ferrigenium kumadai TaxID=1682490 RepID=A0AAN1W001_9PROT|nr:CapA family protein [Ferrigenium kumadai]BBI99081.1 capsule biosynthesis protein [Ferrigenium kumadai]